MDNRIGVLDHGFNNLKAYAVLKEDENTGGIVFARHSIVALRSGANQYGDGDIEGWRATRAQWADKFAEDGRIPLSDAIEHGWNFECHGCGSTIDESFLEDSGLPIEGVIGHMEWPAYCCAACADADALRKKRVDAARAEGLSMLRAQLLARLPDAKEVWAHAYARDYDGLSMFEEGSIHFDWPGMKIGPASIDMRRGYWKHERIGPLKPVFHCCAGDKEAFEAYAEWTKHLRATEAQPS